MHALVKPNVRPERVIDNQIKDLMLGLEIAIELRFIWLSETNILITIKTMFMID